MVIAPVSLIFLSVPVSSSALACPAQNAAASARPITRSCFIRTPPRWMISAMLASIGYAATDRAAPAIPAHAMTGPPHELTNLHRLIRIRIRGIGRLGELLLQLGADRRVEVQSLGRDLLHEPLVIQLHAIAALVEGRGSAVDHFLEGRIVLAQHDAVGFGLRERVM